MLPERTTTTGDSLPVTHINAFHMIRADATIIPEVKERGEQIRKIHFRTKTLPISLYKITFNITIRYFQSHITKTHRLIIQKHRPQNYMQHNYLYDIINTYE